MSAKLHLAKDSLALHSLLQHLEGLVHIVVTDENLHAAFLFNRAVGDIRTASEPLSVVWRRLRYLAAVPPQVV
jgi:hypothetical protein